MQRVGLGYRIASRPYVCMLHHEASIGAVGCTPARRLSRYSCIQQQTKTKNFTYTLRIFFIVAVGYIQTTKHNKAKIGVRCEIKLCAHNFTSMLTVDYSAKRPINEDKFFPSSKPSFPSHCTVLATQYENLHEIATLG